jgi:Skp family chaperone for outer membrane proteins
MKRISIVAVLVSTVFVLGAGSQAYAGQRAGAPPQTPPARPSAPAPAPTPAQPAPAAPATTPQAPATPPPFPAGAKIGFVNMQLVVAESKLGKSGQDRMKKLHDDNQTKLAQLAKAIQDQQQKMNTQSGAVSDTALQAMKRELDRMQLDAQAAQQKANADEQNLNEDLLNDFSQKAMPVIEALRVEKDLWVILGVTDNTEGGGQLIVASANPGLDLSLEVVKRLDAQPAPASGK